MVDHSVDKQAFDAVLARLIQAKPMPLKDVVGKNSGPGKRGRPPKDRISTDQKSR